MLFPYHRQISEAAPHVVEVGILGHRLTIRADDLNLANRFGRLLHLDHETGNGDEKSRQHCFVMHAESAAPVLAKLNLRQVGDLFQEEIGPVVVIAGEECKGVVLPGMGRLLVADGFMLLVIDGQLKNESGEALNLSRLADILLAEIMIRHGKLIAHAGGTGSENGVQLWTGPNGAGKTTRVLELVMQGQGFYGDDLVIVGRGPYGQWMAWPLNRDPKVTKHTAELLPELASKWCKATSHDKGVFSLRDSLDLARPRAGPVQRINLIDGSLEVKEVSLDLNEAWRRVCPCFLYGIWSPSFPKILAEAMDIIAEVPVYAVARTRFN